MTQVAVYGSLRQTMGNHRLLEGQPFVGTTVTKRPYSMYSLGGFPKVDLLGDDSQIVVEIYDVDEETHRRLDQLEGYRGPGESNFYDCTKVELEQFGSALMYHIDGSTNDVPVPNGDWVAYMNQRYTQNTARYR